MTGEDSQTEDRFNAKLTTGGLGETGVTYARTGYLGFIKRTDFTQTDGGRMLCSTCLVKQLNDLMSIVLVIHRAFLLDVEHACLNQKGGLFVLVIYNVIFHLAGARVMTERPSLFPYNHFSGCQAD